MKLLQKILVPIDFSESSINSLQHAVKVSEAFNSEIIVLNVMKEESLSEKTESLLKDSLKTRFEESTKALDASTKKRISFQIEKGVVFEQIIRIAIKEDINVIIAGAGADTDNEHYKLSTVMEKLMRKSQIPLWVIKKSEKIPFRKILCPVDFSDASTRALNNAIILASKFNAELSVMYVFTPINIQSPRMQVDNEQENRIQKKRLSKEFEEYLSGFNLNEISHKVFLKEGQAHQVILSTIEKENFDLLMMGTTGRTGISRIFMGSVTEKVTRELPCSFITTKSKDITRSYFESNLGEIETYIQKAKHYHENGEYAKSIEYYSEGLKQHPDNIPMLTGLIQSYTKNGDHNKAVVFTDYARDVISRLWGEEFIEKLGFNNTEL
jgi:nucleotide-binding universal stress UspA family protein